VSRPQRASSTGVILDVPVVVLLEQVLATGGDGAAGLLGRSRGFDGGVGTLPGDGVILDVPVVVAFELVLGVIGHGQRGQAEGGNGEKSKLFHDIDPSRVGVNTGSASVVLDVPVVVLFEHVLAAGGNGAARLRAGSGGLDGRVGELAGDDVVLDVPVVVAFELVLAGGGQSQRREAEGGNGEEGQFFHGVLTFFVPEPFGLRPGVCKNFVHRGKTKNGAVKFYIAAVNSLSNIKR